MNLPPGIHPLRGLFGSCHLLIEGREAVLIDTGLIGEIPRIEQLLRQSNLSFRDLRAILLTHGHLDHTGNLARLAALSGAPVFAHEKEAAHIAGQFPYRGWSRVCGALEAAGRTLLHYQPTSITHFLQDGETLLFCGGLNVIHLPGHTAGHCGFYSPRHHLLFSGDLFASYRFSIHQPPPFLNSCPELLAGSLARVQRLNPQLILPNHYDRPDPLLHRSRFDRLMKSLQ